MWGRGESLKKRYKGTFGGDGNVLYINCGDDYMVVTVDYMTYTFVKLNKNCTSKKV